MLGANLQQVQIYQKHLVDDHIQKKRIKKVHIFIIWRLKYNSPARTQKFLCP